MAALSIATDLGMGQPLESALCSCVVAMRLGEALNLDDETLHDVYYQALLRYIGCNADTYAMAALFGDELALRHDFAGVDTGRPPDVLGVALRYLRPGAAGEPPLRTGAVRRARAAQPAPRDERELRRPLRGRAAAGRSTRLRRVADHLPGPALRALGRQGTAAQVEGRPGRACRSRW